MVLVVQPDYVTHSGTPIFSIDISPDGQKYATGGGDAKIKLWNTAPLRDDATPHPRLLAVLENHTQAVNVVRFSPLDDQLASGADDGCVLVWTRKETHGVKKTFGSNDEVCETWTVSAAYRAHQGDVNDLCWSPDGSMIVSCSLSCELLVWQIGGLADPIARLIGHASMIKGVAFDPLGRFVASASDDCTVRVWRTSDWAQEVAVEAPFLDSQKNSYYRRLSWSPDGQTLTCSGSINGGMPTAVSLTRGTWKAGRDLVGHQQPVVAVAWNQGIFNIEKKGKNGQMSSVDYALCAIGSQDCGLSIWGTHKNRSIMVLANLHKQSIVDLAWDKASCDLLACSSSDGTVTFLLFNEKDLGRRLSSDAVFERMRKIYGDAAVGNGVEAGSALVEDPALLLASNNSRSGIGSPAPKKRAPIVSPQKQIVSVTRAVTEQQESRKGNKRRITPATLVTDVQPASSAPKRPRAEAPSSFPVPVEGHVAAAVNAGNASEPIEDASSSFAMALKEAPIVQATPPPKNPAGGTSQGKKRIAPIDLGGPVAGAVGGVAPVAVPAARPVPVAPVHVRHEPAVVGSAFVLLAPAPTDRIVRQFAQTWSIEATYTPTGTQVKCVNGTDTQWTATVAPRVTHVAGTERWSALGCADGTLLLRTSVGRLLVPAIALDGMPVAVEASSTEHLLVISSSGAVKVWNVELLLCTVDASVQSLYTGIEPQYHALASASIGSDNMPIVTLPTYESFVFHASMKAWLRVVDRRHLQSEHTSVLPIAGAVAHAEHDNSVGVTIAQLREQAKRTCNAAAELLVAGRALLGARNNDSALAASIEHLEHRLAVALLLGPRTEQVRWIRAYAKCTAQAGLYERLHELLTHLLGGPIQKTLGEPISDSDVPSFRLDASEASVSQRLAMRSLVREALAVIRELRPLQRVFTHFQQQLQDLEAQDD